MLVLDPGRSWTQAELADETELDKGLVSNLVRQLGRDCHVTRSLKDCEVRIVDPQLLLGAWREVYDLRKHHINYGTDAARSGPELLRSLAEQLAATRIRLTDTGLAGASLSPNGVVLHFHYLYAGIEQGRPTRMKNRANP